MAKKKTSPPKAKAPAHEQHTEEQRRAARKKGEQEAHYFYYDDLVRLTGKSRGTIARHKYRAVLDPDNLESVLYWVARHAIPSVKRKLLDYALEPARSKNPADE